MPGNSNDEFVFVGSGGGPAVTLGELTQWAILEFENGGETWDQGAHSSQQENPRSGLPNIFPDAEDGPTADLFVTIDFLAGELGYV